MCFILSELCIFCLFVGFGVASVVFFYWEEKVKHMQCFGFSVQSYLCVFVRLRERERDGQ